MASKISPADQFTTEFLAGNLSMGTVAALLRPPSPIDTYVESLVADACEPRVTVTHENGYQVELALSDAVADLYALTMKEPEAIAKQLLRGEEMFAGRCVYQLKARA